MVVGPQEGQDGSQGRTGLYWGQFILGKDLSPNVDSVRRWAPLP